MESLTPTRQIMLALLLLAAAGRAPAQEQAAQDQAAQDQAADQASEPETYSLHGQLTDTLQYHPPFTSPYRGANSLDPGHRGDETTDATLFAGIRLWPGAEFYVNPEVDQGFGLSDTLGLAGFSSGEAYKVGDPYPYIRIPRAFFRFTLGTGGEMQRIEPDKNQLGGAAAADNVTVTAGKFGVTDIFDNNAYAHDPRADFLNWSVIDAGAFDYAADAWGFTYGLAAEWNQGWWTLRAGIFDLSRVPNSKDLVHGFGQYSLITEAEERHDWFGEAGKLRLLLYVNRARLADYTAAIRAAEGTGQVPDVALVRTFSSKPGAALNLEQALSDEVGLFARASLSDGHKEAEEFTEINRSLSGGLSIKGTGWGRKDDTVGLALALNGLSRDARAYLAAGGLGILIGDGQLKRYDGERILEAYYSLGVIEGIALTLDYQLIENPAYNPDRGPVSILGWRTHLEF